MEDNFSKATRAIDIINRELESSRQKLRDLQPIKHGSVQLELHNCGKDCKGCPHPRWKVWKWSKRSVNKPVWVSHLIKHPAKRLKKTGDFEAVYGDSLNVIRYATSLIKIRKELLEEHRKLGSVLRPLK